MMLLPVHILAGLVAIVAGYIAVFVLKGGRLHRKSGMIFVYAMLTLAASAAVIATIKSQKANQIGAVIAFYLVTTGLLTLRRSAEDTRWIDAGAMVLGLVIGFFSIRVGLQGLHSASGTIDGVPPAPMFVFGTVALLAALGDMRVWVRGINGKHRIARHVWRMCFALFVATGSFFLGQAKVFPKPMRIIPLLAIPAVLPLVLLIYWMVRVLLTKWYRRRGGDSFKPEPAGGALELSAPSFVQSTTTKMGLR